MDRLLPILVSILRSPYFLLALAILFGGLAVYLLAVRAVAFAGGILGYLAIGASIASLCYFSWQLAFIWAGRTARERLIETLSDSDESLFLTNEKGRIIFESAAFRNLISDVNSGDLMGFSNLGSFAELVAPKSEQSFNRLRSNAAIGKRDAGEVELKTGNQASRYWRLSVDPVGTIPGLNLWTAINITSHRRHEQEKEAQDAVVADLLDHLPVGFFSADEDGSINYMNDVLANWLGVDGGRHPGKGGQKLQFADFVSLGHDGEIMAPVETDSTGMHGSLRLIGEDGEAFTAYLIQSQKESSGGDFEYSRSIVLREPFTPVVDDGTGAAILRRIPWVFTDSPVGIVLVDLEGMVTDCNRSFLKTLGLHRDGVVGFPVGDRINKEDRDNADAALSKVVMGIMPATLLEVRVPISGEREITASLYVSPIEDADGEIAGLVLHMIDTTERKNLEVQFNQAQKMQAVGQLAGGVAHDFNNLLTAMGGFCDLLLSRHGPDDPSFPDIMQIKQNANRAGNLVRQLLAFSRRQTLQPKIFSITDALNDLSTMLRRLLGENVELELVHGENVDLIRTDPGQFDQVIMNLAVNARDAMKVGGTITITTDQVTVETSVQRGHEVMPAGEYIRINVADTGSGIAKEDLTRIFEPFFSTKGVGEGTGLGLATVYGIVRQSDGYIFVDSALGEGTTFSIYLPAFSAAEATAFGAEISEVGKSDEFVADERDLSGEATVLLVEDEDAVRVFGSRALTNKGYRVLEAMDGEHALDVINEFDNPIDLIITDVMMPGMDGHTLVRLVQEELPDIKVILMSGYAEDAIPGEIEEDSSLHFLPKPFSLQELAGKVKEVMGGS
jgi:two-component system cell cycle sensor histidine kinase/response regulator CckA